MIKQIIYYFKLKKLLQEKELMQFVKYELQTNGVHKRKSLLGFCISHWWISMWLDTLVNYFYLREKVFEYAKNDSNLAEVLIKRYNQANDYWYKNVKR
jgi:hypothetical protein